MGAVPLWSQGRLHPGYALDCANPNDSEIPIYKNRYGRKCGEAEQNLKDVADSCVGSFRREDPSDDGEIDQEVDCGPKAEEQGINDDTTKVYDHLGTLVSELFL